jgi:hypothetical protein
LVCKLRMCCRCLRSRASVSSFRLCTDTAFEICSSKLFFTCKTYLQFIYSFLFFLSVLHYEQGPVQKHCHCCQVSEISAKKPKCGRRKSWIPTLTLLVSLGTSSYPNNRYVSVWEHFERFCVDTTSNPRISLLENISSILTWSSTSWKDWSRLVSQICTHISR